MMRIRLQDVKAALELDPFDSQTAHRLMAPLTRQAIRPPDLPGRPREGCVLVLLYCHAGDLHLLLTRRRDDMSSHAGQVSFPGGRREAAETPAEAALRETHEEVGVPPTAVAILGQLTPIWIPPSDFHVYPFVGWVHSGERPTFRPAMQEVAAILETPLAHLLAETSRKEGTIQRDGYRFEVPYFDVEGHMVWGATAVMLSEFVERLRLVLASR